MHALFSFWLIILPATTATSSLISNLRPRPCSPFICISPCSNPCTIFVYFHSFVSERAPYLPLGQIGLHNVLLIHRSTFPLDFFCALVISSFNISVFIGSNLFGLNSFSSRLISFHFASFLPGSVSMVYFLSLPSFLCYSNKVKVSIIEGFSTKGAYFIPCLFFDAPDILVLSRTGGMHWRQFVLLR